MPFTTPRHFSVGFFIGVFLAVAVAQSAAQNKPAAPAPAQSAEDAKRRASPVPAPELKWDALAKSYEGKPGDTTASFEFHVTNTSAAAIAIESILTSCGCTVAELPPLPAAPFVLERAASTTIRVSLDLHGKMGTVSKSVTVGTSSGLAVLTVNATVAAVPAAAIAVSGMGADRAKNIEIATDDRQAIFKGDCAKCHATPAAGKMGQELFRAACTICHEANPRASMIPDLNIPRGPRELEFWHKWIAEGGAGTMMPAFAASKGGPLNEEQVASLALYLFAEFSRASHSAPVAKPAAPSQK